MSEDGWIVGRHGWDSSTQAFPSFNRYGTNGGEKRSMAVGSDWEIYRRPTWQRPSLERHVNDLELASIDVMIEMGAVHVPTLSEHSQDTLTEGEVRHIISSTLFVANVDPAKIYAYLCTGYLVTVENVTNWNPRQLTAWDNAIAAYHESNAAHA
jgi:hypothetical protein